MGAARRLRFGLRAAAAAMALLLLLLPSSLSLALSPPPPPPPFFPPQWAPPVPGGGGPFAEAGGGYGSGGGGPGGIHEPPISFVYNNPYIPTEHGVGYGSGPDGSHNPTVSSVHGNQYMPTGKCIPPENVVTCRKKKSLLTIFLFKYNPLTILGAQDIYNPIYIYLILPPFQNIRHNHP
ncbi:uncharacterized protein LOC127764771 [Oryza glaberrima]|uniref:uncharacterized protein LOC127764771 n=1 Tax=Oryza glaberrima TaxID=4538 RepID=UPI00224C07C1|nr:uncharacterized protein LOC127764771 [Oryza glaberrima]